MNFGPTLQTEFSCAVSFSSVETVKTRHRKLNPHDYSNTKNRVVVACQYILEIKWARKHKARSLTSQATIISRWKSVSFQLRVLYPRSNNNKVPLCPMAVSWSMYPSGLISDGEPSVFVTTTPLQWYLRSSFSGCWEES